MKIMYATLSFILFIAALVTLYSPLDLNEEELDFANKIKDLADGKINEANPSPSKSLDHYHHTIELNKIATFDWDIVCTSWPYEDFDGFKQRVKFQHIEIPKEQKWQESESFIRFVFIKQNRIEKVIRLVRGRDADFNSSDLTQMEHCLSNKAAKISARRTAVNSGFPPIFITVFNNP